jgi:hypothetical protein
LISRSGAAQCGQVGAIEVGDITALSLLLPVPPSNEARNRHCCNEMQSKSPEDILPHLPRISCLANLRDRTLRKLWKHVVFDVGMIR